MIMTMWLLLWQIFTSVITVITNLRIKTSSHLTLIVIMLTPLYGQSFYFEVFNFLIDTISLVLGSLRLLKRVLYYCPYRLEGEKTLELA